MKRICPHPFSSVSIDVEGKYRLCCEANPFNITVHDMSPKDFFSSDVMNDVRDKFIDDDAFEYNDIRKYCSGCKMREKVSNTSKRKRDLEHKTSLLTNNFINNIDEYIETGKISRQYSGLHIEGFGNRCNLKCLHCSSRLSSGWAKFHDKVSKDPDRPEDYDFFHKDQALVNNHWLAQEFMFNNDEELYEFIEEVKQNSNLKSITATGGEALLNKHFRIFYKEIIEHNPDIHISINTNASIPTKLIKNVIDSRIHPRLTRFTFSCDGLFDVHEFIRDNSTWKEYTDCLSVFVDRNIDASPFASVQILNIFQFDKMVSYLKARGFKVKYHLVFFPERLNISILPKEIKELLIEKYDKINDDNFYDPIINALNYDRDPTIQKELFSNLFRYLDMQSELKNKEWRTIFPELAEAEKKYR